MQLNDAHAEVLVMALQRFGGQIHLRKQVGFSNTCRKSLEGCGDFCRMLRMAFTLDEAKLLSKHFFSGHGGKTESERTLVERCDQIWNFMKKEVAITLPKHGNMPHGSKRLPTRVQLSDGQTEALVMALRQFGQQIHFRKQIGFTKPCRESIEGLGAFCATLRTAFTLDEAKLLSKHFFNGHGGKIQDERDLVHECNMVWKIMKEQVAKLGCKGRRKN